MKNPMRSRFRFLTSLQVSMLAATIFLFAIAVMKTTYIAVPAVLALVILAQIIGLIRFVQAHVDALEDFFAAVNYEDFTRRFIEDDLDAELKDAFNRVLERFQDARAERDLQAGYLDTVVRHVPVPFIACRDDGTVSLINHPARKLTGLGSINHVRELAELDPELPSLLQSIEPGQQRLLQSRIRDIPVELRVSVAEIRMAGSIERLYSIENLSGELSARESSAWRNLIRVLTHEIMNTLTPVTSLAETTAELLQQSDADADIQDAMRTIQRRSQGLMKFVSHYRELLQVPVPEPEHIVVSEALHEVTRLLASALSGIEFAVSVEPASLQVFADRQLIDQVLVNLVKNAAEALAAAPAPSVSLDATLEPGRTVISISDNGPGIPADELDQVFIPFFTTKRDGSGIGLSLCRQVMTAHGGEIAIDSGAQGTTVKLIFP